MFWVLLILTAILSAGGSTQSKRQFPGSEDNPRPFTYLLDICEEGQEWSEPTRPCETMFAIQYQCSTSLDYDDTKTLDENVSPDCSKSGTCQSFGFQRTCFCQSQWHDSAQGCLDCYSKHGRDRLLWVPDQATIYTFMSAYCDLMVKPTAGFGDWRRQAESSTGSTSSTGTTPSMKFSDLIGFKLTEVILYYYTPSMTGIKAWATTLSTIRGWAEDYISVTQDTTAASLSHPASTSFSATTSTPAPETPSTQYSTVYINTTSSPTVGENISISRKAPTSFVGIVRSLGVVAMVVSF